MAIYVHPTYILIYKDNAKLLIMVKLNYKFSQRITYNWATHKPRQTNTKEINGDLRQYILFFISDVIASLWTAKFLSSFAFSAK